jgi:UDP-N-acetyl-D-galactosamine dehydrogenase
MMVRQGFDVFRSTVGILGVTFKENCPDIRNSKIVDLVDELKSWGVCVRVSDLYADPDEVMHEYGIAIELITPDSPVDALIIAVPHDGYTSLSCEQLKSLLNTGSDRKPIVADLKSVFDRQLLIDAGFEVFRL